MASNVPGVLYFSGFQALGPQPNLYCGDPEFDLQNFNRPALSNFVPGGAVEGNGFFPWYDASASDTLFAASGFTSNSITATPSPGWTTNDPNFLQRQVTVLAPLFGIPGFPLILIAGGLCNGNSAATINIAGSWNFFPGQTSIPGANVQFRIGQGRFDVYHPAPGAVGIAAGVSRTLGGSPMSGGRGAGADITFMQLFASDVWNQAPFFYALKAAQPTGFNSGWKTGGPTRQSIIDETPRITAAAAAHGDTIQWKLCTMDVTQEDMRDAGLALLTLEANIADFHAWLKTWSGNPAIELQLVAHHPDFLKLTKPGAAIFARNVLHGYARKTARTRVLDLSRAEFGATLQHSSGVTTPDPAPDFQYYRTEDYWDLYGKEMVRMYQRSVAGVPEPTPSNVVPIVYMLGDSLNAGGIDIVWVQQSFSKSVTGPTPMTTARDPRQRVYNRQAGLLQTADPAANSNRSGDVSLFAGPDIGLHERLAELFPGPNGYILVKRGASSSSLANLGIPYTDDAGGQRGGCWDVSVPDQHFFEFQKDIAAARALAWEAGFIPDDRLLYVDLGTNDSGVVGGGAKFAAALEPFCVAMRNLTRTRSSGPDLMIRWSRPYLGTAFRSVVEMAAVRAAIMERATKDARFQWFNTDDLERNRDDQIHDTPDSAVERGHRAGADLGALVLV